MAVIDRVKWDSEPRILAWKHPSEELSTWTQLIVNESQEAFLVRDGIYEGPFGAGRHTLSTENIPLLRSFIGIPFGGKTPFGAEVWFVNKYSTVLNVLWGTPDPIPLIDPVHNIMVPVRSFGQYGIRISNSKKFLIKTVGTKLPNSVGYDIDSLADSFRGFLITRIKSEIANAIINNKISILEVSTQLDNLSNTLRDLLTPSFEEYGVTLTNFNINSINYPDDDPSISILKSALSKKAEMEIVGYNYQQERSLDVMQSAAENEGSSSQLLGAGMGLGMGVALGAPMGGAFSQISNQLQTDAHVANTTNAQQTPPREAFDERIRILRELADLKTQGILTEEEFLVEKQKVLGEFK